MRNSVALLRGIADLIEPCRVERRPEASIVRQQQEGRVVAEARIGVRVADDRKSATVEIGPIGGASEPIALDIDQLTTIIRLLGQARARMVEGTEKKVLDGNDPPWHIQVARFDGSLIAFDHPSYGPLAFALPRVDIANIVQVLTKHLQLPAGRPERPS